MIDKSKLHPNLIKEIEGERYKYWKPSWKQMREAVRWSNSNDRHVGDFPSVRAGALSYLEGLYKLQLEAEFEKLVRYVRAIHALALVERHPEHVGPIEQEYYDAKEALSDETRKAIEHDPQN